MSTSLLRSRRDDPAPASNFAATVPSLPAGEESAAWGAVPETGDTDAAPLTEAGPLTLPSGADAQAMQQRPTLSYIGRYALKALIGTGGLGRVHEAWDPLLSRTVAVKTLQFAGVEAASRVALDRMFLEEARAAAGLSHAYIVTVHDAGLSPQGVYIAMQRLQGCDLGQRVAGGWRPTPAQAARLVRRVADALAYAHGRGVVHCDIKPANIFLERRDRPQVLDFGIARVAHRSVLTGPAFDGAVAGSPRYLAPEQLQGGAIDARTDIHALGVVFHELLTGRKAYAGNSLEQITRAVLADPVPPAHELRPEVPRALSAIAARAMARNPSDRYASAADMATDLRRWADMHQAHVALALESTRPPALPPRLRSRQRRGGVTAAALAGAALASALTAGLLFWKQGLVPTVVAAPTTAATVPTLATTAPMAATVTTVATATVTTGATATTAATTAATTGATVPATAAAAAAATARPAVDATPAHRVSPVAPADRAPTAVVAAVVPVADAATPRPVPAVAVAAPAWRATPVRAVVAPARATRPGDRAAAHVLRDARAAPVAAAATPVAATPPSGALHLAISPWGEVEIDGTAVGPTPPLVQVSLPTGAHRVTVRNADFPPHSVTVEVVADRPVSVRHRFAP